MRRACFTSIIIPRPPHRGLRNVHGRSRQGLTIIGDVITINLIQRLIISHHRDFGNGNDIGQVRIVRHRGPAVLIERQTCLQSFARIIIHDHDTLAVDIQRLFLAAQIPVPSFRSCYLGAVRLHHIAHPRGGFVQIKNYGIDDHGCRSKGCCSLRCRHTHRHVAAIKDRCVVHTRGARDRGVVHIPLVAPFARRVGQYSRQRFALHMGAIAGDQVVIRDTDTVPRGQQNRCAGVLYRGLHLPRAGRYLHAGVVLARIVQIRARGNAGGVCQNGCGHHGQQQADGQQQAQGSLHHHSHTLFLPQWSRVVWFTLYYSGCFPLFQ